METLEPSTPIVHPKTQLRIGNWNVRTLCAPGKAAQAAKAMRENKLQIMGMSESRWCGSGKFILSTGETIVYSGRDDEVHQHGVAIMLNKDAAKTMINWAPIGERIIRARFHSRYVKLTLIHVFAPTNDTDEEVKDHFHEKFQAVVEKGPKHDFLVIAVDLSSKVGSDVEGYERVMSKHGVGTRNDNGEKLCDFCGMNDLVITGTIFPHKEIHKQLTWISPDRRTCNPFFAGSDISGIFILQKPFFSDRGKTAKNRFPL